MVFKPVQAVVIDVHFPENPRFRHFTEIAVGLFPDAFDKGEHIRVRYADRATQTLCVGEQIPVGNRLRMVEIFKERKIEKGHVRAVGQGVAVLCLQSANLDTAKDFYLSRVLVAEQIHVVEIATKRFTVISVEFRALIPAKFRARATHAVVVVANPKLSDSACNRRFNHLFGFVLRAEGIICMSV